MHTTAAWVKTLCRRPPASTWAPRSINQHHSTWNIESCAARCHVKGRMQRRRSHCVGVAVHLVGMCGMVSGRPGCRALFCSVCGLLLIVSLQQRRHCFGCLFAGVDRALVEPVGRGLREGGRLERAHLHLRVPATVGRLFPARVTNRLRPLTRASSASFRCRPCEARREEAARHPWGPSVAPESSCQQQCGQQQGRGSSSTGGSSNSKLTSECGRLAG